LYIAHVFVNSSSSTTLVFHYFASYNILPKSHSAVKGAKVMK